VRVNGDGITGLKAGVATIVTTGVFCLPVGNRQPKSCAALTITVH
jgi:hypothetical protein